MIEGGPSRANELGGSRQKMGHFSEKYDRRLMAYAQNVTSFSRT